MKQQEESDETMHDETRNEEEEDYHKNESLA
jgi:hypothetical protein